MAGPAWSETAFETAARYGQAADETPIDSPCVRLLADIRACFDGADVDKMTTADLLTSLHGLGEAPWSTWERGKPLSAMALATLLRRYKIQPKQIRSGGATPRGYERRQFDEAFAAYLPKKAKHPKQAKHG